MEADDEDNDFFLKDYVFLFLQCQYWCEIPCQGCYQTFLELLTDVGGYGAKSPPHPLKPVTHILQ